MVHVSGKEAQSPYKRKSGNRFNRKVQSSREYKTTRTAI